MSGALFVVYVIAIVGLIALRIFLRGRSNPKFQGAATWPVTDSTVEFVSVEAEGRRRDRHNPFKTRPGDWMVELAYSYSVDGHFYSGFYQCRFPTEENARSFSERLRGKRVPVQYKPEEPEVSLMSAPAESLP